MRAAVIYNPVKIELDDVKAAFVSAEARNGWDGDVVEFVAWTMTPVTGS